VHTGLVVCKVASSTYCCSAASLSPSSELRFYRTGYGETNVKIHETMIFPLRGRVCTGSRASPCLLCNAYKGLFPRGQSSRSMKSFTNLHVVSHLRIHGAFKSTSPYIFMALCLTRRNGNSTLFIFTCCYMGVTECL
jgi:hypothetical protein